MKFSYTLLAYKFDGTSQKVDSKLILLKKQYP